MTWSGASSGEHFVASNPASALGASVSTPTGHTSLTGGGLDGRLFDTGGWAINVRSAAYGALAAMVTDPAGAITSGAAILTSPFHVFTAAMVGWNVMIQNAGGSGGQPFVTTMFGCDAEQAGKLGTPTDATWGYSIVLVNSQDIHWIGGWNEGNLNGTVNIKTGRIDGFIYLPAASTGIAGANGFNNIPSNLGRRCEVLDMSANTPAYYTSKRRTLLSDIGVALWTEGLTSIQIAALLLGFTQANATDTVLAAAAVGDGFNRFIINASGLLTWGPGNAGQDVTLGRTGTATIGLGTGHKLATAASATARSGFIVPHGAAPTSPVDGDMWSTTAGLFIRVNGVTKTVTLT